MLDLALLGLAFGDVLSHAAHDWYSDALGAQGVAVFPPTGFATGGPNAHQAARCALCPDLGEVRREGTVLRRREQIDQVHAQQGLAGVAGEPDSRLIHREQSSFEIVGADQGMAVFNQIAVAVLCRAQRLLGLLLAGDILKRVEPSRSFIGVGLVLQPLHDLPDLDPCPIGAPKPVLDFRARALDASFDGFGAKACAVLRVEDTQPLARALRHLARFHANQLRQALRPALEGPVRPRNYVGEPGHDLRTVQSCLALDQFALRLPVLGTNRRLSQFALQHVGKPRQVPFQDIITRTGLERIDRNFLAGRPGNQDERDVHPGEAQDIESVQAGELRHVVVRNYRVPGPPLECRRHRSSAFDALALHVEAPALQHPERELGVVFRIFDHQHVYVLAHFVVYPGGG